MPNDYQLFLIGELTPPRRVRADHRQRVLPRIAGAQRQNERRFETLAANVFSARVDRAGQRREVRVNSLMDYPDAIRDDSQVLDDLLLGEFRDCNDAIRAKRHSGHYHPAIELPPLLARYF